MASLDNTLDTQKIVEIKRAVFDKPFRSEGYVHRSSQDGDSAVDSPVISKRRGSCPNSATLHQYGQTLVQNAPTLPSHATPPLIPSKSVRMMPAIIDDMPSQLRAYHSFDGLLDRGGGDTQPMDSQIYKNYTSAIMGESAERDNVGVPENHNEGDVDQIDIVGNWERDISKEPPSGSHIEDLDELSPETQHRLRSDTSATFIPPKTPATAGKKRNYHGDIISSVTRTPGSNLAAMFGGNGAGATVMSLSQVFNATQAPSSPLPNAFRSDPVFQRPSPNFVTVRHSSPPAASSSPSRQVRSDPHWMAMEPRDMYMTMKESQELRERRKQERQERARLQFEELDEFDAELTAEEQRAAWRRKRAEASGRALLECATLTAPSTNRRGRRTKRTIYVSSDAAFTTPATAKRKAREVVEISDGIPEGDESSDLESEEDDGRKPNALGQAQNTRTHGTNNMQVPMTSSRPAARLNGEYSGQKSASSTEQLDKTPTSHAPTHDLSANGSPPGSTTQTVAVVDSQPELTQAQESIPVPQTLVEPSSVPVNLRIAQSQLPSLSGNAQAKLPPKILDALDTSSVPRPPPLSSEMERNEAPERMPSSPPLIVSADLEVEEDEANDEQQELDEEVDSVSTRDTHPADSKAAERGSSGVAAFGQPTSNNTAEGILEPRPLRSRPETGQSTIPETDPVEAPASSDLRPSAYSKAASTMSDANDAAEDTGSKPVHGANTGDFETARSHFSASPQKRQLSQAPGSGLSTPKHARLRSLTDIASSPSIHDPIGDIDIDINLMTEADNDFAAVMSGSSPVQPSRKRRKMVYKGRAIREPVMEITEPPSPTPPSAKKHEERGALAAIHARQAAIANKPIPPKEGKLNRPTYKAIRALETGSRTAVSATTQGNQVAPIVSDVARPPRAEPGSTGTTTPSLEKVMQSDSQAPNAAQAALNKPRSATIKARGNTTVPPTDDTSVTVPNRVMALFKGGNMAYYPATCLGLAHADGLRFKVRFDDGTVDNLEPQHVRRLDLRVGDMVKVDLNHMRMKTYEICSFKNKLAATSVAINKANDAIEDGFPLTDQYGYRTVVLAVKRRDSLPAAKQDAAQDKVEVPITSIYLTSSMWSRFKDRVYTHAAQPPVLNARLQTPSDYPSAPVTPTSKSRRLATSASLMRDTSVVTSRQESTLFSNMAFAVTFSNNDDEKDQVTKLILDNGGRLLGSGFDSLFQITSPDSTLTSPSKSPSKSTTTPTLDNNTDAPPPFRLTYTAESLGFTALIADRHSRRAKYMQALALGLPCLHPRWIRDCASNNRILDFAAYLLPAGESAFLGGAVRSRVLAPYSAATARFAGVVEGRKKLLEGKGVVLVMGKGRAEERRRAYLFLTYALGARRVERVRDLEGAKKVVVGGEGWDWVYVDGQEREAERVLFGGVGGNGSGSAGGRKRRRAGDGGVDKGVVAKKVKIVGDETVIQSLILGALVDE